MKTTLFIISVILAVVLILGWLLFFGPLTFLVPTDTRTAVTDTFPDYFRADNRPGLSPSGGSSTGDTTSGNGSNDNGGSQGGNGTVPTSWQMPGQGGLTITVTPFWVDPSSADQKPSTTPPSQIVTFAEGPKDASSTPLYSITYFPNDTSFTLSLLREPIGEARRQGEQDLIKRLNITEHDACTLNYVVLTSRFVNAFYSGKNLGFSFCKGAPQF